MGTNTQNCYNKLSKMFSFQQQQKNEISKQTGKNDSYTEKKSLQSSQFKYFQITNGYCDYEVKEGMVTVSQQNQ